jgi:hypothetical protein
MYAIPTPVPTSPLLLALSLGAHGLEHLEDKEAPSVSKAPHLPTEGCDVSDKSFPG